MKEDNCSSASTVKKEESEISGLFGRSRYKLWVLIAVLLLAFWSMFTGSVTLKWSSAGHLFPLSDDVNFPIRDDLDILEVEEREKMVRHMWDVYTHGSNIQLPQFWQEAFQAGYEYLVSDLPGVRDAALSEIAKMSMFSMNLNPVRHQFDGTKETRKRTKQAKETKAVTSAKTSRRKARR